MTIVFPLGFSYRAHQHEAITFAKQSFQEGKNIVIFEAPSGFGKSVANVVISSDYPTSFYITPQVSLVDQLARDRLLSDHVDSIRGKSNYNCILKGYRRRKVDMAPCEKAITCEICKGEKWVDWELCQKCKGRGVVKLACNRSEPSFGHDISDITPPECPYYRAKWRAARGGVGVMTLAYMLLASTVETKPVDKIWNLVKRRFQPRNLLIVDEAHGTADSAASFISLTLSKDTLRGVEVWKSTWKEVMNSALPIRNETDAIEFIEGIFLDALKKDIDVLQEIAKDRERKTKADQDTARVESLIERCKLALMDMKSGNPWAIDPQEEKITLQPVLIGPFLQRRLWNRANCYLLSTATVLDPHLFLRELGLDSLDIAIMSIPSTFPPERSPIIIRTAGPLTRKWRESNLPKALSILCQILDEEKGRGLIHCHSYENATYIRQHIPPQYIPRLTFHDSKDRGDVLEEWLENGKEDSVLASVAMTEGLDLKDDLARWAVIFKVPYPFIGDKRVARRLQLPDGKHWYRLTTLRTIIQAAGRIIRSAEDKGRVYIIDGSIHRLLRQTREWLPDWFEARIQAGNQTRKPKN